MRRRGASSLRLAGPFLGLLPLQLCPAVAVASARPAAVAGAAFKHLDERQRVAYGIQLPEGRAPLAFAEAVAQDVTSYVRDDPLGPFAAGGDPGFQHWSQWGFEHGGAEPILKADWLASSFWADSPEVFVPRFDSMSSLRRAPPRLLAFVEAFRQVNGACWRRVSAALERLGAEDDEEGEDEELARLAAIFSRALARREHFGVLEAQVWSGGHLIMGSHTDGATGMLHLGLTLGGRRTLRVGKFLERHSPYKDQASRRRGKPPGDEVSVWNPEAYHEEEIWDVVLEPGSAYLSLPFCFEHGVRYESGADDTIVALQCRFAFANESEAFEVNGQRTNCMRRIAGAVAGALAEAVDHEDLRLPTVDEVKAVEAQILAQEPLLGASSSAGPAAFAAGLGACGASFAGAGGLAAAALAAAAGAASALGLRRRRTTRHGLRAQRRGRGAAAGAGPRG